MQQNDSSNVRRAIVGVELFVIVIALSSALLSTHTLRALWLAVAGINLIALVLNWRRRNVTLRI